MLNEYMDIEAGGMKLPYGGGYGRLRADRGGCMEGEGVCPFARALAVLIAAEDAA